MAQQTLTTTEQAQFTYDVTIGTRTAERSDPETVTVSQRQQNRLCVVCDRVPANLTLDGTVKEGTRPMRLCLRCHYAVMQQRRMMRTDCIVHGSSGCETELLVPRSSLLFGDNKYRQLAAQRRDAQKAARRALETVEPACTAA